MRLHISDPDVDPGFGQLMRLLQHTVSFAHTGTHAYIDLELSSMRLLNQVEKMLCTLSCIVIHLFYKTEVGIRLWNLNRCIIKNILLHHIFMVLNFIESNVKL